MNTGSEAALAALAQSQHGILTANDLRHLGISDRTARRRRDDGRWIAVVPGIYRLVGSPVTVRMLEEAVVLWLGVESVGSVTRVPPGCGAYRARNTIER
jgi:Transcriptional regulator, AbiEi antitoxin